MDPVGAAALNGLSSALAQTGEMVTKWVAVVETIDASGKRWIRTVLPDDAAAWDTFGLLTYALHDEQARQFAPDQS